MTKTLTNNNEQFQAERIIKTDTSIIGYNGTHEEFAFRGISDFSMYQLSEGENFDIDPTSENEQRITDLELAIASILGGA